MSQTPIQPTGSTPPFDPAQNKRVVAGILAILLGWVGAQRFYLGDTKGGIIRLLLSCVAVGWIIGVIEGVIYLTKTDEQFYQEYIVGKKAWF